MIFMQHRLVSVYSCACSRHHLDSHRRCTMPLLCSTSHLLLGGIHLDVHRDHQLRFGGCCDVQVCHLFPISDTCLPRTHTDNLSLAGPRVHLGYQACLFTFLHACTYSPHLSRSSSLTSSRSYLYIMVISSIRVHKLRAAGCRRCKTCPRCNGVA
jgi:hypothetical protein